MLIRHFWRDCDSRGGQRIATPIDAFWVEATLPEAEAGVFPRLQESAVSQSRRLAAQFSELAKALSSPSRPFCFLVARDLSSIDPFQVHYPIHPMWNAYSPFESMPETVIGSLEELRTLELPVKGEEASDEPAF